MDKKFNLGFGTPRSDVCTKCEEEADNAEHKKLAAVALEQLQADRKVAQNTDGKVFITFDLQQTMPLPKPSVSIAFYLRQLWFYNLGVHLVRKGNGTEQGIMLTWTENQAGRGSDEVVSALLAALELPEWLGVSTNQWKQVVRLLLMMILTKIACENGGLIMLICHFAQQLIISKLRQC